MMFYVYNFEGECFRWSNGPELTVSNNQTIAHVTTMTITPDHATLTTYRTQDATIDYVESNSLELSDANAGIRTQHITITDMVGWGVTLQLRLSTIDISYNYCALRLSTNEGPVSELETARGTNQFSAQNIVL
jgi:hypothetical protein